MKKVFIGCSSFDSIDEKYKIEASLVADICAKKGYDLSFGSCVKGSMGVVYKTYRNYKERKIDAICMKKFVEDSYLMDKDVNIVITDTTIEQMDIFMKSDKIIYLPGGYGTLTELIYLINAKVNKIHDKDIIIVNATHFYDKILEQFNICFNEKFTNEKDLFKVIENIKDLENLL